MNQDADNWSDDLLDRKLCADHLYQVVKNRFVDYHAAPQSGALCLALDADWGFGKTFFVKRFKKDVEDKGHLVFYFDAWANDMSEDPLIGFIADLQKSIDRDIRKITDITAVEAATKKLTRIIKSAGKAVVPAAGVLAKGFAQKITGVALGEIVDAMSTADNHNDIGMEIAKTAKDASSKAAEKFFEQAIKSHQERQSSVRQFKSGLAELLAEIEKSAPMFIFIDELDRCRPTYAIRLLEGVKHIFDVQGVCFVFSTNLIQLASSVKAVYGETFDGYRYLKKFFAFEYSLPTPEYGSYALSLVAASSLAEMENSNAIMLISGLPGEHEGAQKIASAFSAIAQGMQLDARTQLQVFQHAETVLRTLATLRSSGSIWRVPLLYLFFLCSIFHGSSETLASMINTKNLANGLFPESIKLGDAKWLAQGYDVRRGSPYHNEHTLESILRLFVQWSAMTCEEMQLQISQGRDSLLVCADNLRRDAFADGDVARPRIALLPQLIKNAGFIKF